MYELSVVDPVAKTLDVTVEPAKRLDGLAGKTIGLFWNYKPGGNVALAAVADELRKSFPDMTFRDYTGSVGSSVRYSTPADRARIIAECDAVVGSIGDCGSCTSWLMHDMVQLEKAGVPTVAVTAKHFEDDARTSAELAGLRELPLMLVEHALSNKTDEEVRRMAVAAMRDVEVGLTEAVQTGALAVVGAAALEVEVFSADEPLEAVEQFNRKYLEREWSDGLPLVPATPERVEAMIAASGRLADEVVVPGLYPGLGIATVGKIAVNGVLAGCRPEHMPVLLAMVKAYEATGIMGKTQAISTGPNAPLVLVSGPVVEQLGFNYRTCVAGPGSVSYVNTVIGRALRLILLNIGQAYPGRLDMDTIGTPNKFSWCLAENAGKTPWETWNVARGYDENTSTVTIALVYPGPDVQTLTAHTPEQFLDTIASLSGNYIGTASVGRWLYGGRSDPETGERIYEKNVVLLAPDHAKLMANAGWTRRQAGEYLYGVSKMPFGKLGSQQFPPGDKEDALRQGHPELAWLIDQPDTMVATAEGPQCFEFFVTGGEVGRSQYLFGGSEVATAPVVV